MRVKRASLIRSRMSANDPKRTSHVCAKSFGFWQMLMPVTGREISDCLLPLPLEPITSNPGRSTKGLNRSESRRGMGATRLGLLAAVQTRVTVTFAEGTEHGTLLESSGPSFVDHERIPGARR